MGIEICCPKHKRYSAQRFPRNRCKLCWRVWILAERVRSWSEYCIRFRTRSDRTTWKTV